MSSSTIPQINQQGANRLSGAAGGQNRPQQGLPPTGLQQQLNSLNNLYGASTQAGYDPRQAQFGNEPMPNQGAGQMGSTSLDQLARNLATRYGLPVGRGRIVDDAGNFLFTPDQLAKSSGGAVTMGDAAAQMNYISQALAQHQQRESEKKGLAALQTGLGLVQSRGRGSLAAMQSGYYQDIAQLYANQEFEAADFSYYIQKEQLQIQQALQARQEKMAKKQSRFGTIAGIGLGITGLLTGNPMLAVGGFSSAAGNASQTGWF